MFGFLCYTNDNQSITLHTSTKTDTVRLLQNILPVFPRIQVWKAGDVDNLLWNSCKLIGDTIHTAYANELGGRYNPNSQKWEF